MANGRGARGGELGQYGVRSAECGMKGARGEEFYRMILAPAPEISCRQHLAPARWESGNGVHGMGHGNYAAFLS
ncbi:MAG: hypothetical protein ABFD89_05265 [Bryobacteraceae bacterium]